MSTLPKKFSTASDASRRIVRRSLAAELILVAASFGYVHMFGTEGVLGLWPAIMPVPAWLVLTLLIPLWTGSDAVREEPPDSGWRTLGTVRLWYSARDDGALWVRYPRSVLRLGSAGFTPNLGIAEGRVVLATFVLAIGAMMAMLLFPLP